MYIPIRALVLAVLMPCWIGACYWLRFRYVEADWLVEHCAAHAGDFVCGFRKQVGMIMYMNGFGYAALVLALPALLLNGRAGWGLAAAALLAAGVALSFYNAGTGAPAAVLALLRLVRARAPAAVPRPAAG